MNKKSLKQILVPGIVDYNRLSSKHMKELMREKIAFILFGAILKT